jgi:hypothetical protein
MALPPAADGELVPDVGIAESPRPRLCATDRTALRAQDRCDGSFDGEMALLCDRYGLKYYEQT